MTGRIDRNLLSELSDFVAKRLGLHFPEDRLRDLERGIRSAAPDLGFSDAVAATKWLLSSHLATNQTEILASHLTIGETYFFRDPKVFETLEHRIIPELVSSRRHSEKRIKIMSAACSTGEEPYSIAILLNRAIPDIRDWNITILGMDINHRFLKKASEGSYTEWSFRSNPDRFREKNFAQKSKGVFQISPQIRKMVKFSYLNLAEDAYPSFMNETNGVDIVFCRNALIYFTEEIRKRIADNLYRCIVDGGWLAVSATEASHDLFSQFVAVSFPGAIFYRKDSGQEVAQQYDPRDYAATCPEAPVLQLTDTPFIDASPAISGYLPGTGDSSIPGPPQTQETGNALYEEALALYRKGDFAGASEKARKHLQEQTGSMASITLLAKSFANMGQLSEALIWCRKAVEIDKLDPGCHYLLAVILEEQGNTEEAVTALKKVLYLDHDFVLAHFSLGNLMRTHGNSREAEKHLKNALLALKKCSPGKEIPESDGLTAERLAEIIVSMLKEERAA